MVGHRHPKCWDVQNLTDRGPHDRRVVKRPLAAPAQRRRMGHGRVPPFQGGPTRPGLFARRARPPTRRRLRFAFRRLRRPPGATIGFVARRRSRRVPRILPNRAPKSAIRDRKSAINASRSTNPASSAAIRSSTPTPRQVPPIARRVADQPPQIRTCVVTRRWLPIDEN
jgi:hypothetical protein